MSRQPARIVDTPPQVVATTVSQRFVQWIQDPMGSVIVASIGTMSTLGVVLSSIWAINFALNN